jgi:hypothetical protein
MNQTDIENEWDEDVFDGLKRLSEPGAAISESPVIESKSAVHVPIDQAPDFSQYADLVDSESFPPRLA